jgi:hypothetical protein
MSVVAETNISLSFIGEVDSRYNVFLLPVERKDRLDILDECLFLQANFAKKKKNPLDTSTP